VLVYSFNTKSDIWWQQTSSALAGLPVDVCRIPWESVQRLAAMVERTMQMSVTISDGSAFIAAEGGEVEISPLRLSEGS